MPNASIRRSVVAILGIVAIAVTVGSAVVQAGPTPGTPVDFPDPNLDAAIRAAIGKPFGQIYDTDLETLTSLRANTTAISDLSGLEYATNLTLLFLNSNQISDLSALAGLTNLRALSLSGNEIGDLNALAGLTNLRSLFLSFNQINDLSALAGLTNLSTLFLSGNQISDLSALTGFPNLTTLFLSNNRIINLNALAGLTNLTGLALTINSIYDISPLAGLTRLTSLSLSDNQISDISALAGLTNLTSLVIYINQISDISALAGLTKLTHLFLDRNEISDISALAALNRLELLFLYENQISDISALVANGGMGSGDRVNLRWNPLNEDAICADIPALEARGVDVDWSPSGVIVCPSPTPTPSGADCLCQVTNINPNQVVLQNVGRGGKKSNTTRKMVVTLTAVDAPGATCDPGEFSDPTPVNLKMEDDRGNILIDSAKTVVCKQGATTLKRSVLFQGPLNCENGAVPPPKPDFSLGSITSTGSTPGTTDYVESTKIKCFE